MRVWTHDHPQNITKILLDFILQNEPGRLAMFLGHGIIATYSVEAKQIKSLELHYILVLIITLTIRAHNQSDGRIFSQYHQLAVWKKIDACMFVARSTFCIPLARTNYGKPDIRFKGAILWNNIDKSPSLSNVFLIPINNFLPSLLCFLFYIFVLLLLF